MTLFTPTRVSLSAHRPAEVVSQARRAVRNVLLIMLVGLLLRGGLLAVGGWQNPQRAMVGDSPRYIELGHNLARHGVFALPGENSGLVHIPLSKLRDSLGQGPAEVAPGLYAEGFRTPGYPAILAGFEKLGMGLRAVLVFQVLLSTWVIGLVGWMAWTLTRSSRMAAAAALLLAINPGSIIEANLILSECVFTFLLTACAAMVLVIRRSASWRHVACLGLLVAAAALVRPIAIIIIPLAGLALLFPYRQFVPIPHLKAPGVGRRMGLACTFVLIVAVPLLAWGARNNAVGYGPKLSTVPDVNAWFYTAVHLDLTEQGLDHAAAWPDAVQLQMDRLTESTTAEQNIYNTARGLATQRISEDPVLYSKVLARSNVKFFTDHSMTEVGGIVNKPWQSTGLRSEVMSGDVQAIFANPILFAPMGWMLFNVGLLLASMIGAAVLWRRGRRIEIAFIVLLILGFAFATQTNGLERFRWPVAPMQALLAGVVVFLVSRRAAEGEA